MNDEPFALSVESGSLTRSSQRTRGFLHWDGQSDLRHGEDPAVPSTSAFSSAFQAKGQPTVLRLHPYVTTREICFVPSGDLRKIVWEQEAMRFTLVLDPALFAMPYAGTPRISGELVWGVCRDERVAFARSVHPVLLVHAFPETSASERVEIVPHLQEGDPLLHHMALVLQAAVEGEGIAGRVYVETLRDALAIHCVRRLGATHYIPSVRTGGLSAYKLRCVINYINAHLKEELSLVTLAAVEKTSPAHFARLFKQATGVAPHQYVITCRMAQAKRLLAETEDTLVDIGLQVGCADQSHFTALFHKHVGLTPKAYRDRIKSRVWEEGATHESSSSVG